MCFEVLNIYLTILNIISAWDNRDLVLEFHRLWTLPVDRLKLSYLFAGAFVNETKNHQPLHISKIYITFQLCYNELIQYQMKSSSFFWLKRYGRYLNYKPGMLFFSFLMNLKDLQLSMFLLKKKKHKLLKFYFSLLIISMRCCIHLKVFAWHYTVFPFSVQPSWFFPRGYKNIDLSRRIRCTNIQFTNCWINNSKNKLRFLNVKTV